MKHPLLRIYTQNNCKYCDILKNNLEEWGMYYEAINISEVPEHKQFLKERNHKTVPQLYIDNFNLNYNVETEMFTEEMLYDRLDEFISDKSYRDIEKFLAEHTTQDD